MGYGIICYDPPRLIARRSMDCVNDGSAVPLKRPPGRLIDIRKRACYVYLGKVTGVHAARFGVSRYRIQRIKSSTVHLPLSMDLASCFQLSSSSFVSRQAPPSRVVSSLITS